MFGRGESALERDLGLLSKYEEKQIRELLEVDEGSTQTKLMSYVHRIVRRDETSQATLRNVRRLSVWKQVRLKLLAYDYLPPHEWGMFCDKLKTIITSKLVRCPVKIPFAHHTKVRTAFEQLLRTEV